MKKLLTLFLTLFLLISCCKNEGVPQYNDWLTGTWYFNEQTEYITFYEDDAFIMNDTIQGVYEIQDKEDTDVWYYYVSVNDEDIIGTGIMHCNKETMEVTDLPTHENETIKLYRK